MKTDIECAIFDLDGTLYPATTVYKVAMDALCAEAERRLGIPRAEMFEEMRRAGRAIWEEDRRSVRYHSRVLQCQRVLEPRGVASLKHAQALTDAYWAAYIAEMRPYPDAIPTLLALKGRGVRIGLGTNMYVETQIRKLEALGLVDVFDFVVTSEETGIEKPAPEFFAACVAKAHCPAERCLFVGDDADRDAAGAIAAGLRGVWLAPDPALRASRPDLPAIPSLSGALELPGIPQERSPAIQRAAFEPVAFIGKKTMRNFSVGPVQSPPCVHEIGARDIPYFRTPEFSRVMLDSEKMFLSMANAPAGSKAVFITGSGTAGMEAAVANLLSARDRVLVIDGGSFGHRFAQLCEIHGIPFERIALNPGQALEEGHLAKFSGHDFTALLINMHETSTGVLYDMNLVADFCRRENMFLLVDAISAFLADPLDMAAIGAGAVVVGSQKALACPPGVSITALAPSALARIEQNEPGSLYFDFKAALKDGERGQTPFTPAVGTLLQINARLREIAAAGGAASEIRHAASLAADFRRRISDLPLEGFSQSPSNAVTALKVANHSAKVIFDALKDEFGIWICPNGGELGQDVFRVGHLGALSVADNEALSQALHALHTRGIF